MCLTTKGFPTEKEALKYKRTGEILEKDLTVYKIMYKNNVSPHYSFKYEKGFHYFQTGREFSFNNVFDYWGEFKFNVDRGLHCYSSYRIAKDCWTYNKFKKIVRMVIPKGSKIYRGINGDIVSNNLIWY